MQKNTFNEFSEKYNEDISSLKQLFTDNFESLSTDIQEEKQNLINEISTLHKKLKIAYLTAGGISAVAIVHLVLNLLGVI